MKKTQDQAALLRKARAELGMTNRQLAEALGLTVHKKSGESSALLAWLSPASSLKHRNMPRGSKLLLAAILAQHRAKK